MTSTQVRSARRLWFHQGHLPAEQTPVAAPILASWQRCLQWGLDPFAKSLDKHILPDTALAQRLQQREQLIQTASPHMHYLHQLIRDSSSVVVLADAQGVILQALGDDSFLSKADSVLLKPGASWTEQHRGTNAVGTALVTGQESHVHGSEHYFDPHGFLTCSAVPIRNPQGRIVGVLDISTDYRMHHPHTLGLVRSTVDYIEKQQLLAQRGAHQWILTLHSQAHGLGTLAEGVLLLDEDGTILAANAHASRMLQLQQHDWQPVQNPQANPLRLGIHQLLDVRWDSLMQAHAQSNTQAAILPARSFAGKDWWLKLEGTARHTIRPHTVVSASPTTPGHTSQVLLQQAQDPASTSRSTTHASTAAQSQSKKLSEITRSSINNALKENQGNIRKTAQMLGISRTTLYRYLKSD